MEKCATSVEVVIKDNGEMVAKLMRNLQQISQRVVGTQPKGPRSDPSSGYPY